MPLWHETGLTAPTWAVDPLGGGSSRSVPEEACDTVTEVLQAVDVQEDMVRCSDA